MDFIFVQIFLFIGIFLFILPNRHALYGVHLNTIKMNEISPDSANISGIQDNE
jgi:type IV secretory pathway TrbL component